MPFITPKLDWLTNPVNPTSTDMNRIESNIDFINSEIETKKGAIVDALNVVGIATLITDTHAAIATKITTAEKTGIIITPSTANQVIQKGIYDTGAGVVLGDADLIAPNIRLNKNLFNVVGTALVTEYTTGGLPSATVTMGQKLNSTTSFIKILEFRSNLPGVIRVKFDTYGGYAPGEAKLVKDGVTFGTYPNSGARVTNLVDLPVVIGTVIQLWHRATGGSDIFITEDLTVLCLPITPELTKIL